MDGDGAGLEPLEHPIHVWTLPSLQLLEDIAPKVGGTATNHEWIADRIVEKLASFNIPAIVERYQEAVRGIASVNCDLCAYRAPWPGREDRQGQPIGVGHSHLAAEHRHHDPRHP